ncbi:hypothetical protein [Streptomyces tubercidicus]|uniref:hypothetical protein n=1 Tax=Streptomyces tubercidicus TaxID=47759 RepID=UPI0034662602
MSWSRRLTARREETMAFAVLTDVVVALFEGVANFGAGLGVSAVVPRDVPYEVRTPLEIPESAWQGDVAVLFAHGVRQSGDVWIVGAQVQPDADLLGVIELAGRSQDDAANASVKCIREQCAASSLDLVRVENFNAATRRISGRSSRSRASRSPAPNLRT